MQATSIINCKISASVCEVKIFLAQMIWPIAMKWTTNNRCNIRIISALHKFAMNFIGSYVEYFIKKIKTVNFLTLSQLAMQTHSSENKLNSWSKYKSQIACIDAMPSPSLFVILVWGSISDVMLLFADETKKKVTAVWLEMITLFWGSG